jgi:hypothetical protein
MEYLHSYFIFDCVAVLRTEGPLLFFLGREMVVLQRTAPQGQGLSEVVADV